MFAYDKTWSEIEEMLEQAIERRKGWQEWFEQSKENNDRDSMKEAARNAKALEGVIKTLRWTLGEKGILNPLN